MDFVLAGAKNFFGLYMQDVRDLLAELNSRFIRLHFSPFHRLRLLCKMLLFLLFFF